MFDHYSVLVSPLADRKLASHIRFLALVSEPATTRLYDAYEQALTSLERNPYVYPIYEPISKIDAELHSLILNKRYRIVFEIREKAVYVLDIQDCRQDSDKNIV
jgi:Txe/YoeB family toxin of Txe-Axe toxin-antitoxin module